MFVSGVLMLVAGLSGWWPEGKRALLGLGLVQMLLGGILFILR